MSAYETIGETILQGRPFDSLETEVLLTLLRAGDRVQDLARPPIAEAGLSYAQYNVLRILRGSPEGLQTHQVCERLVARAPNITRLVDKLEAKSLLTRSRSPKDRRVVTLRITDRGLALLRDMDEPVLAATRRAMQGLSAEQQSQLCNLLNRLRAPLEAEVRAGCTGES